ncbi:MAG: hypothetical protein K9I99_14210 [Melioribacteraceae bacterium]|nr:hypothetical protein [Melioribacteraceae bacterium]
MNSRKWILPLLVFSVLLLLQGCFDLPEDPKAPKWNIAFNAPGTDTTITIGDIIEDDSTITTRDEGGVIGLLYFTDTTSIEPVTIDENLNIDNFSTTFGQKIDEISINAVPADSVSVGLSDWGKTPGNAVAFGEIAIFPEIDFPVIDEFEEVVFKSATLNVKVTNRLPIDIDIQKFELVNKGDGSIIFTDTYTTSVGAPNGGGLRLTASGGSQLIPIDLAGKTLTNQMKFVGAMAKPGNDVVDLDPNDAVTVTSEFDNNSLVIESARAELPAQDPFQVNGQVSFADSNKIEEAILESGVLDFTIDNNFDMDLTLDLTLQQLLTPQGQPYNTIVNLQANQKGNTDATINDLSNYSISSGVPNTTMDAFNYDITVTVLGSPPGQTSEISIQDSIAASIDFRDVTVRSFKGKVAPFSFALDPTNFEMDFGDLNQQLQFDQINFGDPEILINLVNSADVEAAIDGNVTASNGTASEDQVIALSSTIGAKQTTTIDLSADFKNAFTNFRNGLPNNFSVNGTVTGNPNYETGTVTNKDSVKGDVFLTLPLDIGIKAGTYIDTLELDSESDSIIQDITSATLIMEITNAIPVDIRFSGTVLDENDHETLDVPPLNSVIVDGSTSADYIFIPAPTVNSSGVVIAEATVKEEISLTGTQIDAFLNGKKLAIRLELMTSNADATTPPQPVKFTTENWIKIKVWGKGDLLVDLE